LYECNEHGIATPPNEMTAYKRLR